MELEGTLSDHLSAAEKQRKLTEIQSQVDEIADDVDILSDQVKQNTAPKSALERTVLFQQKIAALLAAIDAYGVNTDTQRLVVQLQRQYNAVVGMAAVLLTQETQAKPPKPAEPVVTGAEVDKSKPVNVAATEQVKKESILDKYKWNVNHRNGRFELLSGPPPGLLALSEQSLKQLNIQGVDNNVFYTPYLEGAVTVITDGDIIFNGQSYNYFHVFDAYREGRVVAHPTKKDLYLLAYRYLGANTHIIELKADDFTKLTDYSDKKFRKNSQPLAVPLVKERVVESAQFAAGSAEIQGKRPTLEDDHATRVGFMGDPSKFYAGVFDGHGSRTIASFAAQRLHRFFAEQIVNGADPFNAFNFAYQSVDRSPEIRGATEVSGATAVTVYVDKKAKELWTANAGDARAVLSWNGQAVRLSHDHKASDPKEQKRIKQAGGVTFDSSFKGSDWRVATRNGALAVARALGDHDAKGVTADPYITKTKLTGQEQFVILACDGVWDVIGDQEATDIINKLIKKGVRDPNQLSKALVDKAYANGSTDNITAVVALLN